MRVFCTTFEMSILRLLFCTCLCWEYGVRHYAVCAASKQVEKISSRGRRDGHISISGPMEMSCQPNLHSLSHSIFSRAKYWLVFACMRSQGLWCFSTPDGPYSTTQLTQPTPHTILDAIGLTCFKLWKIWGFAAIPFQHLGYCIVFRTNVGTVCTMGNHLLDVLK